MKDLGSLTINNLLILKTIIETGSISKTAQLLDKRQSTISSSLGLIKAKFGENIVTYVQGGYVATSYGLELLDKINLLLNVMKESEVKKSYQILVTDYFAALYLDDLINYFDQNHLHAKFSIFPFPCRFREHLEDDYDVYIGSGDIFPEYRYQYLLSDESIVITAKHSGIDKMSLQSYLQAKHITLSDS